MAQRFCPQCGLNCEAEHSWNLAIMILLLVIFPLIGLLYMLLRWKLRCPRCKLQEPNLQPPMALAMPSAYFGGMPYGYATSAPSPAYFAQGANSCPTCRGPLTWVGEHARWWCASEGRYL